MDIGLFLVNNCFDLAVKNGDLKADAGLETAVTISLFTDRRVTSEQLAQGDTDRHGWWGDMFPEVSLDQIGSRLWTLRRAKRLTNTLRLAEDYSRESLNWLIEDGIADIINITASYDINKFLILDIEIVKPLGVSSRFQVLWDEQKLVRG